MAKKSKKEGKKVSKKIKKEKRKTPKRISAKNIPTLHLRDEHEIAMDFAVKVYKKFDKSVKAIVLFGSAAKKMMKVGSDIDVIIVIDDVAIKWDQELIAWYREELELIINANPYSKNLHINTVKLSTWWEDLMRGDPVVTNVLRYGEALIDLGGFFDPLKFLLIEGKIRSTPEAVYSSLQRAPLHLARSKAAELGVLDGIYWCMIDSAHAALMASDISPPSPEHIAIDLKETFVDANQLDIKYVTWFKDLLFLYKQIIHGERHEVKGADLDMWQERAEEFLDVMARLVKDIIEKKYGK
ncbi:MAG: nucleotidyltransferase domain-containing protein [Nanoarchaeota archaeon]